MFVQRCYAVFFIFVAILSLNTSSLFSQTNSLDREYGAIIMQGAAFPDFADVPIAELFLFSFDANSQTWEMIPFQIDEKDTNNNFVFSGSTDQIAGFDDNDELVFMAADAGDQAFIWLDNEDSKKYPRNEIVISDTLDQNNIKTAWVYLYRSSTLSISFTEDYVSYTPSSNPETGEDFVNGASYKIGGNKSGLFGFLALPQNPELDLLDRQKIRGKTDFILLSTFDEETGFSFKSLIAQDGPVRVIRQLTISLLGQLDAPIPAQFFKNTVVLGGNLTIPAEIKVLGTTIKIQEIRHSIDLSSQATGMTFSNPNNAKVPIDGIEDVINDAIAVAPEINYTHISGAQGTIITLFQLPGTIGDQRKLFYLDKTGVGDPGDGDSYGDSGLIITGDDIEGRFPLSLKFIFSEQALPGSTGEKLAQLEENPLQATVVSQNIDTVPVEISAFSVIVQSNDVHLSWVTAIEINNVGFEIERKAHGTNDWLNIAFVKRQLNAAVPIQYDYVDRNLQSGSYDYRLKQIDLNGAFEYSGVVTATVGLPQNFSLQQNYPNPFNPATQILYQLTRSVENASVKQRTILKIYNILGEEVRTLVDQEQGPGFYSVSWDGKDQSGRKVTSGVYIYRLQYGKFVATKKMVFVQ